MLRTEYIYEGKYRDYSYLDLSDTTILKTVFTESKLTSLTTSHVTYQDEMYQNFINLIQSQNNLTYLDISYSFIENSDLILICSKKNLKKLVFKSGLITILDLPYVTRTPKIEQYIHNNSLISQP